MIDEESTFKQFGYTSDQAKTHDLIVKVCNGCGEVKVVKKYTYHNLCGMCAQQKRRQLPKPKFILEQNCFITGTGIDRILTIEKFGYDPADLKDKSLRNVIAICQQCGKIREIRKSQYHDLCIFCSNSKENNSNWKGGLTKQRYCNLWTDEFREKIRKRFHKKCYLCGKTKENNSNRKLSVHHVNYDKNCLCNGRCEFIPLCGSCHVKTNFNRQIWEDLIMCYLYPERYFMVDL